jgi:hypothetical protein
MTFRHVTITYLGVRTMSFDDVSVDAVKEQLIKIDDEHDRTKYPHIWLWSRISLDGLFFMVLPHTKPVNVHALRTVGRKPHVRVRGVGWKRLVNIIVDLATGPNPQCVRLHLAGIQVTTPPLDGYWYREVKLRLPETSEHAAREMVRRNILEDDLERLLDPYLASNQYRFRTLVYGWRAVVIEITVVKRAPYTINSHTWMMDRKRRVLTYGALHLPREFEELPENGTPNRPFLVHFAVPYSYEDPVPRVGA